MTRVTWMLMLALQLPAADPIRQQAVDELSTRLAERYYQWRVGASGLDENESLSDE